MTRFVATPSARYPDPPSLRDSRFSEAINPGSHYGPRPTSTVVIALLTGSVPRFQVGQLVITAAAAATIPADEALSALRRHAAGDWGGVSQDDWAANDEALLDGSRLLSSYQTRDKTTFWIITESDRTVTTILLPSDY
jgi:hypothetical protein